MKTISIINYKGGVGKTTLTANLAAELAWRGHRVLMIDLDAQASLTFSFISPDNWLQNFSNSKTIKKWFDSFESGNPIPLSDIIFSPPRIKNFLSKRRRGSLDMVASHLGLINVDLELATKLGGANLTQAKRNFLSVHSMLADGLNEIDSSQYEVVLIDCPPNFNIVTKTAIVASDYILVPARPDYLSTLGIDYLIRSTNTLITEYNEYAELKTGVNADIIDPRILYVVFTMIQEYGGEPISSQRPFITQTRRLSGVNVMDPYIKRNDTIFADAPQFGIPIVLKGYSSGSHNSVVDGLEQVTDSFVAGIGL
jgi:chromosome partitioning protein